MRTIRPSQLVVSANLRRTFGRSPNFMANRGLPFAELRWRALQSCEGPPKRKCPARRIGPALYFADETIHGRPIPRPKPFPENDTGLPAPGQAPRETGDRLATVTPASQSHFNARSNNARSSDTEAHNLRDAFGSSRPVRADLRPGPILG